MLKDKKIILGITGGIAAYKSPLLLRLLIKEGAQVKVILTEAAQEFVTPQTLSVLSKNKVIAGFFTENNEWNNHVHLAEWADLMVIAPLTANTLSKMVTGNCDNALMATYLSAWQKCIVAPAMDKEMYEHPGVQSNLQLLESYGTSIVPPDAGELASGLFGMGRMAEPEAIVAHIKNYFSQYLPLKGKTALVNAGPTYEAIDPVRFIGNHSSGKMGIAVAETLAYNGAQVTLVLGPSSQTVVDKNIEVIRVQSSDQMYEAMVSNYAGKHIVVCSAAVADYKPAKASTQKIKKKDEGIQLKLVKTRDILSELGRSKKKQFLVGFALETENVIEYAKGKLKAKKLDMIVANSASEKGSGFGGDTNKISIIDKHNKIINFELKPKAEVACDIVDFIIEHLK
ncbi:MAG: bifunctional phosphopantothenoylcysteine decarboxylase/phosphopantothenate--cysteine ligase CoaBC [Bacteroidia bacterium]|nr:bifunctional phosphopantothenoylcysteine decarboxylase/phosphopantothenate--cysteine ligase CoaBC [Bacteroidia bacterium]